MLIKSHRNPTPEMHAANAPVVKPPGSSFFEKFSLVATKMLGFLPSFTTPILSVLTYSRFAISAAAGTAFMAFALPLGLGAVAISIAANTIGAMLKTKQARAQMAFAAAQHHGQSVGVGGVAHPGMVAGITPPAGVSLAGGGVAPQYHLPNNSPSPAGRTYS